MKASAPKRNYFRIQKKLLRLSKTALLSLFIFATVLGNIAPVFADDTYKAYKTLFNSSGTPVPKSSSIFKYQGPIVHKTEQEVTGLQFSFLWEFNKESEEDAKKSWDHITFPYDDEQFIVRLCSTVDPTKCLYNKVPYRENASPDLWDSLFMQSTWTAISLSMAFPMLGAAAVVGGNQAWQTEYATKTKEEIGKLTLIFRKLEPTRFVKQRAIDILGIEWFSIGAQGGITTLDVPWLTLAQNGYDSSMASFWYCGGVTEDRSSINPTNAYEQTTGKGSPDPNIERFGDLCSRDKQGQTPNFTYIGTENGGRDLATVPQGQRGRSFFKIAEVPVKLPKTFTDAQQQNAQIQSATLAQTEIAAGEPEKLPGCGMFDEKSSILGCVAQGVYYVIYVPIQWFAGLLGNVFDFFLGYSLDDSSYRAEFAVRGWQIVRDFSNIFFIIILVYTGLSTVVGGKANMKQVVPALILNALLINFSLFATRVIIDISNVVARVFYNSMEVCSGKCEKDPTTGQITNQADTIGGYRQLSLSIVSGFNPQQLMSVDSLNKARALKSTQGGAVGSATGTASTYDDGDEFSAGTIAGYFIIVTLISALIMVGIAMMFWKTAFMFLGRVIGLYVAMIFAPFAVLTKGNMPIVGNIKELSWTKWLQDLTNYAILAPIFIFFLYIIYSFLNTDFLKATKDSIGNESFFTNVISVTVPMLIIYFMIQQGVGIAKKYAGTIGEMVQAGAMKVVGAGVGLAAGGAAFAGRNIIGRGLGALGSQKVTYKNEKGEDVETTRAAQWAANANNSFFARKWNNTYSATQTSSFDARNVGGLAGKAGGMLGGKLGLSDTLSGSLGLGADKALGKKGEVGGNVAIDKKRAEKRAEKLANRMNTSHLTDEDAKSAAAKYKHDQAQKDAEKNWEKHISEEDVKKHHTAEYDAMKKKEADISADQKKLEESQKNLKEKEADLQKSLATAQGAGAKAVYEQALKQNQTAQAQNQTALTNTEAAQKENADQVQKLTLQTIEELKKDDAARGKSDAFKKAYGEKLGPDGLGKYNVKDSKSFNAMMRAEYAENYKNQSFVRRMLDEVTDGSTIGTTLVGGTVAAIFPMLAPAVGAALTGVFTQAISGTSFGTLTGKKHSDITDRALGKLIKDATTKRGSGNVLADMEDRLEKHKKMLAKSLEVSSYADIEKLDDADLEKLILKKQAALEVQRDIHDEAVKAAKTKKDTAAQEKAVLAKKEIENELRKLSSTPDKIYDLQEKIDRHKTQTKWNEDNKKKGDDGAKPDKDKSK
ncbi:MAG: hypothetical protein KBB91_01720 [Candidatus Pacebacteria bacterium]|nr:hypothetical protein [Candidatus Paceibacterota bacterium]MBP9701160.1 hypothetical protein [Candidatus Paceibacterota bacterium]